MSIIQIKCWLDLPEDIILSTQHNPHYPPIQLELANGDIASVELEVNTDRIINEYSENSTIYPGWFVVSHVRKLKIEIELNQVDQEDVSALKNCAKSRQEFVFRGETYQDSTGLGNRVATEISEASNRVLRYIRINYGQYWLGPMELEVTPTNLFHKTRCEWRVPNGEWQIFVPTPPIMSTKIHCGVQNRYLEVQDWVNIQSLIDDNTPPNEGFALVTDAKRRFHSGDVEVAFIQLNAALEWASQIYIQKCLASSIPEKSLNAMLKQSYARNLEDWILPLSRQANLDLENNEWSDIQRIRQLRREAAHPVVSTGLQDVTQQEFWRLTRAANSAIAKLLDIHFPKAPPHHEGEIGGGVPAP